MNEIITTILFLFAVIDPLGSVPVYLEAFNLLQSTLKDFPLFIPEFKARRFALGSYCI